MNVPATLDAVSSLGNVETQILDVVISRYTTAAGFVVLLYDFLLTLPDEVSLPTPEVSFWSPLRLLIHRFVSFGPALSPSPRLCTISIDMPLSPCC